MNRPRAAHLHLSPLRLQQGLFAVLALLVTLIAGQQFQRWNQASAQVQRLPGHSLQQTHFSALGASISDPTSYRLTSVDQAQVPDEPFQQRWVF
ncbi:hypothetical protein HX882_08145 [Pseudomonas gingeri]|uniref:Uncharacterized protein n=1 Tax=Pseudomonas gingeri TaxID=117681 RepID=A0A7Y8C1E0_9PSED|nr:hypothetical protein [Pseudomonas gingeri]NWB95853.1 hypothetical protein [Pseudomonas gingeri]